MKGKIVKAILRALDSEDLTLENNYYIDGFTKGIELAINAVILEFESENIKEYQDKINKKCTIKEYQDKMNQKYIIKEHTGWVNFIELKSGGVCDFETTTKKEDAVKLDYILACIIEKELSAEKEVAE